MVGWQAVEKLLCDLSPPSALGALALLIPVLLRHAMKAFRVFPEPWWYQRDVFWFPTEKNPL